MNQTRQLQQSFGRSRDTSEGGTGDGIPTISMKTRRCKGDGVLLRKGVIGGTRWGKPRRVDEETRPELFKTQRGLKNRSKKNNVLLLKKKKYTEE